MATTSIISAVMSKYLALTAANFPSSTVPAIYLDEPPAKDGSGADIRPPYVILRDNGQVPQFRDFERTTQEVCEFTLEVYYPTASGKNLENVDTAVSAIKWNGGTVGAGSGFDYGTLSDLTSPRSTHEIRRMKETRNYAGFDYQGARVYVCRLDYRVMVKESP